MVRSIEIPEPLFECDSSPTWDPDSNEQVFRFTVMVGGKFPVFEKTYRSPDDDYSRGEDYYREQFLGEFSVKFKALMA